MWETIALLCWLAIPVLCLAFLGGRYVQQCRAELDRARSYVDETYDDIERLLAGQRKSGGRHHR